MKNSLLEKKYSKYLKNTKLTDQTDIKEVENVWEQAKSDFQNKKIDIPELVDFANYLWAYHIQPDFKYVTSDLGSEIFDIAELIIHVSNMEEYKDSPDEHKKELYQRSLAEIELSIRQLKMPTEIKNRE